MEMTTESSSSPTGKRRRDDDENETRCKERNDLQPTDRSSPASSPSSFPSSVSDLEMSRYLERCENTVHRPRSEPVTRSNTYRHPIQEEMLQAYDEFGLIDLASRTRVDKNAADLLVSRLIQTPHYRIMTLLGQLEGNVLRSILCNTFDSEAMAAKETGNTWILHEPAALKIEVDGKITTAPGMYVNVFAPAAGGGLSRQQLGLFVLALLSLSKYEEVRQDSQEKLVKNGENVEHGVKYQIRKMLGRDLDGKERDDMKHMMNYLAVGWDDRLRSVSPDIEHFGTCVIGGWAIDVGRRLEQDEHSTGTPLFFTMIRCVLLHLFPELHFTLRQYVILRPFRPDDAVAGESIVHQLFGSYVASGGCNDEQAGVFEAGVFRDSPERLDPEMCRKMETVAIEHGLMALSKRNIHAEKLRMEVYEDVETWDLMMRDKERLREIFRFQQQLREAATRAIELGATARQMLNRMKKLLQVVGDVKDTVEDESDTSDGF
ncbi:unnamed protein product [Zymoseptoria tritici ST99CH_1A5]|uniref:Uncharacterized protein n=1 Tax=Zymoseptoria tritici ST99CH_1A5 TaxID=1276529 RepID=A0A1Y6LIB0_ZYMTR|nr:unnamed protein product [Zymoseptoria tritici ST99CH_1A5]